MAANDNLIDQANRLMRRRVFVASGAQPPSPPAPVAEPAPPAEFDDLPVLTEVFAPVSEAPAIAPEPVAPPEPVIPQEAIDARAAEMLAARLPFQRQAVADELATWLDKELPLIVMRILDGVTDQIIGQITAEAKAALLPRLHDSLEADDIAIDDTA